MSILKLILGIIGDFIVWYAIIFDVVILGIFILEIYIILRSKKIASEIIDAQPLIENSFFFENVREEYKELKNHFMKFHKKNFSILSNFIFSQNDELNVFHKIKGIVGNIAGFLLLFIIMPFLILINLVNQFKSSPDFRIDDLFVQETDLKKIKQGKNFIQKIKEMEKTHDRFIDNLQDIPLKKFNDQLI